MRIPLSTPNPELDALIARAKLLPPMTPAQREAQRLSWVVGELMLEHPEMTRDEAVRRYQAARGVVGDPNGN